MGSAFGQDASSRQTSNNVNRSINLSGSAVNNQPITKNSGNVKGPVIRVGKNGTYDARTYTTVQGIDEDRLAQILDSASRLNPGTPASAPILPSTGGTSAPGASPSALDERIDKQIDEGTPDEKGNLKTLLWVAGAGMAVLLLVVGGGLLLLGTKKKG